MSDPSQILLERVAVLEAEMDGLRWRIAALEGKAAKAAARRPSRRADPTRRGLTPVREIAGKG